jgi:hypothetical protein
MDEILLQTWIGQIWGSELWNNHPLCSIAPPQPLCKLKRYFVDNPQADFMPVLPAGQAHPGTETVFVRMSTFVPHFLAPLFLAEQRLPKHMLKQIVPALVQEDLLLGCKPMVDWLKAAVVYENTSYILSVIPDTVLLAVDNALTDHRMILHRSDLPGCWATPTTYTSHCHWK